MFYIVQLADNEKCIIDAPNEFEAHAQCDATFGEDGWVTMVPAGDDAQNSKYDKAACDYLSTVIKSYMLYSKLDAATLVNILEDIADSILEDKLNEG